MLQLIGIILMIAGGARFAWALLFYLLNVSGRAGAHLSKKVGTDNDKTDEHIEGSKKFDKELFEKLLWSGCIIVFGFILYLFG
ncbi:MAG: hypothetical protein SFY56_08630 [Bacteroidota bacterium]|nr:hypothetical protein [Bacteroidota bacterium]